MSFGKDSVDLKSRDGLSLLKFDFCAGFVFARAISGSSLGMVKTVCVD